MSSVLRCLNSRAGPSNLLGCMTICIMEISQAGTDAWKYNLVFAESPSVINYNVHHSPPIKINLAVVFGKLLVS